MAEPKKKEEKPKHKPDPVQQKWLDEHKAPLAFSVADPNGQDRHTVIAQPKAFSTGSTGYQYSGKVELTDGQRLQVTANFVVVGSGKRDG